MPNQISLTTIITGGEPVEGLPFMGETMTCCMCGKEHPSDPKVESNWRRIEADGKPYYVCTDHFPADGASAEAFKEAYLAVFLKILDDRQGQP
jgi:hypothetical protein